MRAAALLPLLVVAVAAVAATQVSAQYIICSPLTVEQLPAAYADSLRLGSVDEQLNEESFQYQNTGLEIECRTPGLSINPTWEASMFSAVCSNGQWSFSVVDNLVASQGAMCIGPIVDPPAVAVCDPPLTAPEHGTLSVTGDLDSAEYTFECGQGYLISTLQNRFTCYSNGAVFPAIVSSRACGPKLPYCIPTGEATGGGGAGPARRRLLRLCH